MGQNALVRWGGGGGGGTTVVRWDKTLWRCGVGGTKHFGQHGEHKLIKCLMFCFIMSLLVHIDMGGRQVDARKKQIKLSLLHNVLGGRQVGVRNRAKTNHI